MEYRITEKQLQRAVEAFTWNKMTDDPLCNWLVDCFADEYVPYDSAVYLAEIAAWKAEGE